MLDAPTSWALSDCSFEDYLCLLIIIINHIANTYFGNNGYLTASKKKEQQLQAELDTIRRMYHDKEQQQRELQMVKHQGKAEGMVYSSSIFIVIVP